eukprot:jgi/Tetstr1/466315/TSEL_010846.t1
MVSAGDRLKAALDGLIYLPSLQAGGDAGGTPTEAPSSASPGSAVAAGGAPVLCRPWDRADLLRRLQSFRAASWFCKPAPLGPVPCAMRGWINAATDTLKCEVCSAKVICELSPSSNSEEYRRTVERYTALLDDAHTSACPWRGNACSPWLQQFPTISRDVLLEQQKLRVKALSLIDTLPEIKASAVEMMAKSQRPAVEKIMGGGSLAQVGRSKAQRREAAQQLVAACGWEVQIQGYAVRASPGGGGGGGGSGRASPATPSVQLSARRSLDSAGAGLLGGGGGGSQVDSHRVVLHCPMCAARVGLWNFKPGLAASRPLWQLTLTGGVASPSTAELPPTPRTPAAPPTLSSPAAGATPSTPAPAPVPSPAVQRALAQTIGGGDLSMLAHSPSSGGGGASTPGLPSLAARTVKLAATAPPTPAFGPGAACRAPAFGFSPPPPRPPATTPATPATPASQPSTAATPVADSGGPASGQVAASPEGAGAGAGAEGRPSKRARVAAEAEPGALDPIALHRPFCPWVSTGTGEARGLRCGWMRVLEAMPADRPHAAAGTPAPPLADDAEHTEDGQTIDQYRKRFMTALFNP